MKNKRAMEDELWRIPVMKGCRNKKQKTTTTTTTTMDMGEDTVAEIFLWLPVKSLLKFKSLSKRWFYLISSNRQQQQDSSYFHNQFISTMSIRNRHRIVGCRDEGPIMLGSIFQNCIAYTSYGKPHYLPTSVELMKFSHNNHSNNHHHHQAAKSSRPCPCPPFTLDQPTDFLLRHLAVDDHDIFIVASSNGFLLCSLGKCNLFPIKPVVVVNFLLANPITKEWAPLPETKAIDIYSYTSFICKGDYPHLASVEYTIVRLVAPSWLVVSTNFCVEILSNGDDRWRRFNITTSGGLPFELSFVRNNMVVATSCQGRGGIEKKTVYVLGHGNHQALSFELDEKKLIVGDDDMEQQQLVGMVSELPRMDIGQATSSLHLEVVDGAVHYILFYGTHVDSKRLEVWVLMDNKEWYLKHNVYMGKMLRETPWIDPNQWDMENGAGTVEGFHPLNPNLILLTVFHKKLWYNVDTRTIELVADFTAQHLRHNFIHFAYQWPCWPPLL